MEPPSSEGLAGAFRLSGLPVLRGLLVLLGSVAVAGMGRSARVAEEVEDIQEDDGHSPAYTRGHGMAKRASVLEKTGRKEEMVTSKKWLHQ
jgi:hypothetical protein